MFELRKSWIMGGCFVALLAFFVQVAFCLPGQANLIVCEKTLVVQSMDLDTGDHASESPSHCSHNSWGDSYIMVDLVKVPGGDSFILAFLDEQVSVPEAPVRKIDYPPQLLS